MTFAKDEVKLTGLQPAHSKHVESRAQGTVAQAIFANPKLTRPVIDRDFHNCEAGVLDERGNETVHSLERNEGMHADAAHGLQGAARVAHPVADKAAAHEICYAAAKSLEQCVPSKHTIAADEISAALDFGKKLRNVPRIVLQIAVKKHNRLPLAARIPTSIAALWPAFFLS